MSTSLLFRPARDKSHLRGTRLVRTRWITAVSRTGRYSQGKALRMVSRVAKGRISGQHCGTGCCRWEKTISETTDQGVHVQGWQQAKPLIRRGGKAQR